MNQVGLGGGNRSEPEIFAQDRRVWWKKSGKRTTNVSAEDSPLSAILIQRSDRIPEHRERPRLLASPTRSLSLSRPGLGELWSLQEAGSGSAAGANPDEEPGGAAVQTDQSQRTGPSRH